MGRITMEMLASMADKMKGIDPYVTRIVCHEDVIERFKRYLDSTTDRKTYDLLGVKIDVLESKYMPEDKILCLDQDGNPMMVVNLETE